MATPLKASEAPVIPQLGSPAFFLDELVLLMGQFDAAVNFDDWDMARVVFESLIQNAWSAHVMITGSGAPLRCPALGNDDVKPCPPLAREWD